MSYGFEVDKSQPVSIARQLETQMRKAILAGGLKAGAKLPPTRNLAKELNVARNTIIQVYEQLIAEGYLESTVGSGTFVSAIGTLPMQQKKSPDIKKSCKTTACNVISFHAGNPDGLAFPRSQWAKLIKEAWLDAESETIGYGTTEGSIKLRKAISSYIYRVKGIQCDEDQIVIVPGAAGGLDILAQTFNRKDARIAIEDPCIGFMRVTFEKYGYEILPVEVDSQGLTVAKLHELPAAALIYAVPSHQFPIGSVLTAARRVELIKYACDKDAYIIEDDYDSEFRYNGEVIQPLWNLNSDRVIYLGSFSKIFSPSLRLGYLIIPEQLKERLLKLMEASNLWVNTMEQAAMAEFINSSMLDRHIYKMKKLYEGKRRHLISCLNKAFGDKITISGENAGLHLLLSFYRELSARDLSELKDKGVEVDYVEDYAVNKGRHANQLVLGYGALNYEQIEEGVRRMAEALN